MRAFFDIHLLLAHAAIVLLVWALSWLPAIFYTLLLGPGISVFSAQMAMRRWPAFGDCGAIFAFFSRVLGKP